MEPIRILEPVPETQVIILGMGLTAHEWATDLYSMPGLRAKTKVWTVNWGGLYFDHDLLFNSHNFYDEEYWGNAQVVYSHYTRPIVTLLARQEAANQLSYPLEKVVSRFNTSYLENGVAYMLAYALLCFEEAKKLDPACQPVLRLYGCDYNYRIPGLQNVWENGRACVEFWLGIAHSLGVNVGCARTSELMDSKKRVEQGMYGWGNQQPMFDVNITGDKETLIYKGIPDRPELAKAEQSIPEALGGERTVSPQEAQALIDSGEGKVIDIGPDTFARRVGAN